MDRSLKAIEILKDHIIDLENMALIFEEYCMHKSRDETNKAIQELTEAITELEALENRSCNNCLYFSNSGHGFGLCNKGVSSDFKIGTFYCNKWEVKNECS